MAALLLLSLATIDCNYKSNVNHDTKLNELKQISAETPVYSDFREVGSNNIIKNNIAVYSIYYNSTTNYNAVRNFYSEVLIPKGWSSPKEESLEGWFKKDGSKRLIFRRGEYAIYVEYAGSKADASTWIYGLTYEWAKE